MSIISSLVDIIKQRFALCLTQTLTAELNTITNQISDLPPMYNKEIKSAFSLKWSKKINKQLLPTSQSLHDSVIHSDSGQGDTIKPICSKISCRSSLNCSFASVRSFFDAVMLCRWLCEMIPIAKKKRLRHGKFKIRKCNCLVTYICMTILQNETQG